MLCDASSHNAQSEVRAGSISNILAPATPTALWINAKLSLEGETNLLSHEELGSDLYKILGLLTGKKQLMELSKRFANSNHTKLWINAKLTSVSGVPTKNLAETS